MAIQNYAQGKGVPKEQVSLQDVENSKEGIFYWATVDGDWRSRGKEGQAFHRAVRHNMQATEIYAVLDDSLAKEFRQKWSLRQSFEFVKEERTIRSEYSKTEEDAGRMVTKAQLAVALGVTAYPEGSPGHQDVHRQVDRYFDLSKQTGGRFFVYNKWLDAETVLLVEKLLRVTCSKSWAQIATESTTTNKWETKARECKARRAFAIAKGLHVDAVSLSQVESSPEGVAGWADTLITVGGGTSSRSQPAAGRGAGGLPKPKGKAKAKPGGEGGKTAGQYEKDLKSHISKEMTLTEEVNAFKEKLKDAEPDTAWADGYIKQLDEANKVISTFRENTQFLRSFEKACLSPEALRKLKKETGDEYQACLLRCIDGISDPLNKANEILEKLKSMGIAANPDIWATPKKHAKGKKRKQSPGSM